MIKIYNWHRVKCLLRRYLPPEVLIGELSLLLAAVSENTTWSELWQCLRGEKARLLCIED